MINKNIITFILGIIYLSDIYKLNSFELNNINILIIILIIRILSKLNVIEGFSDTCFEGNDCACAEDGLSGYKTDDSNTDLLNKLKNVLGNLENIEVDGDLTIRGDAYFENNTLNIGGNEIKMTDFNIEARNKNQIYFSKSGSHKNIFFGGHTHTNSMAIGGKDFTDRYNKLYEYVNSKHDKIKANQFGMYYFSGNMVIRGNLHVKNYLECYADAHEGKWGGGALHTHLSIKPAGSKLHIWSTGLEYWRKCGSWWSAW